jgi:4-alpha-glucanotransferase
LAELARAHGVATEYWDWQGRHVVVSATTIRAVLSALGVPADTDDQVGAAARELSARPWRRRVPPFSLAVQGESPWVAVHVPHGLPVTVRVDLEGGGRREVPQVDHWVDPREVDGALIGEATFALPADLPLGWHRLRVQTPGLPDESGALVVAPRAIEAPASLTEHGAFGLMTQLYSVRSRQSWGIGDLADVANMAVWSARDLGADFVLVNPLHAAEPVAPMEPSPYLPSTRRFVNPIYLRVEDIPEVAYLPAETRAELEAFADAVRPLNTADHIDRDAVWSAKIAALRLLHEAPRSPRRAAEFAAYRRREGQGLDDFALWCALAEQHGAIFEEWPPELRDPRSPAVSAARTELAGAVEFHTWLQWLMDEQLAGLQWDCRQAGMSIGVMQDLAVGVHPDGADSWALGPALARGVTVGAPPDPYNQLGQDWSQPPWRPDQLALVGYGPYRDMLRAALRHSGALRIDHVIGLFRLWWVPEGHSPVDGTYVRYDHQAMIGILALEAHRAGAVIVGEDLGTVEPWVRDYLRERGILGTSILWFERGEDGRPRQPEDYRRLCLASVTTHDLPPTAGYLTGEHIDVRARLNLFTRPVEAERAEDEAQRQQMIDVLRQRGLLGDDDGLDAVIEGLHRYLSWSPALLLGVAVPDLVGDRRAVNQPGTDEEYPNWRVPLAGPDRQPLLLEDLMASRTARRLTQCLHRGRQP